MKRKFKLADGTIGMLDTDTGEFTPGERHAPAGPPEPEDRIGKAQREYHENLEGIGATPSSAQFPLPGQVIPKEPERGLVHEDPIGDAIVGNKIAGGLPSLLEAAGSRLGAASAGATTRLATRAAEEEAATLAAKSAPSVTEGPIRKLGNVVEKAVDLHHPLRPVVNAGVKLLERPVDRMLASPAVSRMASAAQSGFPGMQGAAYLLYLMGHGMQGDEEEDPSAR